MASSKTKKSKVKTPRTVSKPKKGEITRKMEALAHKTFAIDQFRPGQEELIRSVLAGKDSLGIMPTGSGKSLCFQLPSVLLGSTVLVVSPLISLMQDQEEKMLELGVAVAKLDSTLTASERHNVEEALATSEKELVYVTPERLENTEFLELLKKIGVSLVVVDEAHCISQWGHDFRPSYTGISAAVKALGRPPIMALTATATSDVMAEITSQLGLVDPVIVKQGINRENLIFKVINTVNEQSKEDRMIECLRSVEGASIVYVATVKAAEEVAEWLLAQGVDAAAYHGKLTALKRQEVQQNFMNDKCEVIVATKAFGMGIDKPDIRMILHYQFPDSLESYYQEAGRGGRDGLPADIVLLYQLEDKRVQSYFLGGKYPGRTEIKNVLDMLNQSALDKKQLTVKTLAAALDLSMKKLQVTINYLVSAEIVKKGRGLKVLRSFDSDEELEKFLSAYESRHQTDLQKLEEMMHYAQTMQCRMQFLQHYFGEENTTPCRHCDNCKNVGVV